MHTEGGCGQTPINKAATKMHARWLNKTNGHGYNNPLFFTHFYLSASRTHLYFCK